MPLPIAGSGIRTVVPVDVLEYIERTTRQQGSTLKSSPTVCFPVRPRPEGGGNYVLEHFIRYLAAAGIVTTHDIDGDYDVIFTNHWSTPYLAILRAFRKNIAVRVIHRIDGSAQDYGRAPQADLSQRRVSSLADATLFQSKYARYATRVKFPLISQDGPVVYNPVDLRTFSPEGPKDPVVERFPFNTVVSSVSWSSNPRKGAASLYEVARANPDVGFVLAGNFPSPPDLANLLALGVVSHNDLPLVHRSCNAYLTFSENEACPNAVIEALACGLPVLYDDSGGTPEVVGECGKAVTIHTFRQSLDALVQNQWASMARKHAEAMFSPDRAFGRYVALIERALGQPTRVPPRRRRQLAWNPVNILSYNYRLFGRRARALTRRNHLGAERAGNN